MSRFLAKIGRERARELRSRVASSLKSTFASHYAGEITLLEVLGLKSSPPTAESLREPSTRSTLTRRTSSRILHGVRDRRRVNQSPCFSCDIGRPFAKCADLSSSIHSLAALKVGEGGVALSTWVVDIGKLVAIPVPN